MKIFIKMWPSLLIPGLKGGSREHLLCLSVPLPLPTPSPLTTSAVQKPRACIVDPQLPSKAPLGSRVLRHTRSS